MTTHSTTIKPRVIIISGSERDRDHFQKIAEAVQNFDIEVIIRIASAHKTAEYALNLLHTYEAEENIPTIYITVAGRSNALSGFVDGAVSAPVIACPPPSDAFGGVDIFSSLRMPSGIAATLVLSPKNAALLAAKMLALHIPELRKKLKAVQQMARDRIVEADHSVA